MQLRKQERVCEKDLPYGCPVCGKQFATSAGLKIHSRCHNIAQAKVSQRGISLKQCKSRTFVCSEYGKRFFQSSNLNMCLKVQKGTTLYQCEACEKQFAIKSDFVKHLEVHCLEKETNTKADCDKKLKCEMGTDVTCDKKLKCETDSGCTKKFKCETNTNVDFDRQSKCETIFNPGRSKVSDCETNITSGCDEGAKCKSEISSGCDKQLKCKHCDKMFTKSINYEMHLKSHVKSPIHCHMCGKSFKEAQYLSVHMRVHTGDKPYTCQVCNKSFSQFGNYSTHLRTHSGEKPFSCDLCHKTFTCSGNRDSHRRIHTGEKPFMCDICGLSFARPNSLKMHRNLHMGERPYQCDQCDKAFVSSGKLVDHKRTHSGEKPYSCEICGLRFAIVNTFRRHKRIHTGQKPHACIHCGKRFYRREGLRSHLKTHTGQTSSRNTLDKIPNDTLLLYTTQKSSCNASDEIPNHTVLIHSTQESSPKASDTCSVPMQTLPMSRDYYRVTKIGDWTRHNSMKAHHLREETGQNEPVSFEVGDNIMYKEPIEIDSTINDGTLFREPTDGTVYREHSNGTVYREPTNCTVYRNTADSTVYRESVDSTVYREPIECRESTNSSVYRNSTDRAVYRESTDRTEYRESFGGIDSSLCRKHSGVDATMYRQPVDVADNTGYREPANVLEDGTLYSYSSKQLMPMMYDTHDCDKSRRYDACPYGNSKMLAGCDSEELVDKYDRLITASVPHKTLSYTFVKMSSGLGCPVEDQNVPSGLQVVSKQKVEKTEARSASHSFHVPSTTHTPNATESDDHCDFQSTATENDSSCHGYIYDIPNTDIECDSNSRNISTGFQSSLRPLEPLGSVCLPQNLTSAFLTPESVGLPKYSFTPVSPVIEASQDVLAVNHLPRAGTVCFSAESLQQSQDRSIAGVHSGGSQTDNKYYDNQALIVFPEVKNSIFTMSVSSDSDAACIKECKSKPPGPGESEPPGSGNPELPRTGDSDHPEEGKSEALANMCTCCPGVKSVQTGSLDAMSIKYSHTPTSGAHCILNSINDGSSISNCNSSGNNIYCDGIKYNCGKNPVNISYSNGHTPDSDNGSNTCNSPMNDNTSRNGSVVTREFHMCHMAISQQEDHHGSETHMVVSPKTSYCSNDAKIEITGCYRTKVTTGQDGSKQYVCEEVDYCTNNKFRKPYDNMSDKQYDSMNDKQYVGVNNKQLIDTNDKQYLAMDDTPFSDSDGDGQCGDIDHEQFMNDDHNYGFDQAGGLRGGKQKSTPLFGKKVSSSESHKECENDPALLNDFVEKTISKREWDISDCAKNSTLVCTKTRRTSLAENNALDSSRKNCVVDNNTMDACRRTSLAENNALDSSRKNCVVDNNTMDACRRTSLAENNALGSSRKNNVVDNNTMDACRKNSLAENYKVFSHEGTSHVESMVSRRASEKLFSSNLLKKISPSITDKLIKTKHVNAGSVKPSSPSKTRRANGGERAVTGTENVEDLHRKNSNLLRSSGIQESSSLSAVDSTQCCRVSSHPFCVDSHSEENCNSAQRGDFNGLKFNKSISTDCYHSSLGKYLKNSLLCQEDSCSSLVNMSKLLTTEKGPVKQVTQDERILFKMNTCGSVLSTTTDGMPDIPNDVSVKADNGMSCNTAVSTNADVGKLDAGSNVFVKVCAELSGDCVLSTDTDVMKPDAGSDVTVKLDSRMMMISSSSSSTVKTGMKCAVCKTVFVNRVSLDEHIRQNPQHVIKCQVCGKEFTDQQNLKMHSRVHTHERPYECEECGKRFTQSGNYVTHMRIHTGDKPYLCVVCKKGFTSSGNRDSHQKIHTGDRPYMCDICGEKFSRPSSLKTHRRTHTGERPYRCDLCDKGFVSSGKLADHRRIHTGEKPYVCEVCGLSFAIVNTFRRHKRIHSGERPHTCVVCSKSFVRLEGLRSHQKTHSKDKQNTLSTTSAAVVFHENPDDILVNVNNGEQTKALCVIETDSKRNTSSLTIYTNSVNSVTDGKNVLDGYPSPTVPEFKHPQIVIDSVLNVPHTTESHRSRDCGGVDNRDLYFYNENIGNVMGTFVYPHAQH
ncbi:uncharacterized protein LOC121386970 [Gigantopelta aegis]|uniref:uncharacterized protein LOC121386970 n=1 Tax=Gigantopelta aegis TaxID=1735272 RepID=UPI001B888A94|nr:uncharacterized protein LOC121386970 [Gigantopelta aegis]